MRQACRCNQECVHPANVCIYTRIDGKGNDVAGASRGRQGVRAEPTRGCSESIGGPDFTRTYTHIRPHVVAPSGVRATPCACVCAGGRLLHVRTPDAKTHPATLETQARFRAVTIAHPPRASPASSSFREEIDSARKRRDRGGFQRSGGTSRAPPERSRARRAAHTLPKEYPRHSSSCSSRSALVERPPRSTIQIAACYVRGMLPSSSLSAYAT